MIKKTLSNLTPENLSKVHYAIDIKDFYDESIKLIFYHGYSHQHYLHWNRNISIQKSWILCFEFIILWWNIKSCRIH